MRARRRVRRAVVFAVAAALAASAQAGAALPGPLGHAGRWITDRGGRVVILHGFNVVGAYQPPGRSAPQDAFGFDRDDAEFLAREGFDSARVGIIGSDVEPAPGKVNSAYIGRIAELVRTLGEFGIFTLLDFHQGDYGPAIYGYGLPEWATLTEGLPNPNLGFGEDYVSNPALERAFDNLYADAPVSAGVGVDEALGAAYARVAAKMRKLRTLLGYDLLNEPWPGSQWSSCAATAGCPAFDQLSLTPFFKRLIAAVRSVDQTHLVFYEPNLEYNFGNATNLGPMGDPRAGFSFHDYCLGAGGGGAFPEAPNNGEPCSVEEQEPMAHAEARAGETGDALILSEWGATDDLETYARVAGEADQHMMSWDNWAFYNDWPAPPPHSQSIIIDPFKPPTADNVERPKLDILARPYPRAIAGTPQAWSWDPEAHTFTLAYATARAGGGRLPAHATTEVVVPQRQFPISYRVEAKGAAVVSAAGAPLLRLLACRGASVVNVTVAQAATPIARGGCSAGR